MLKETEHPLVNTIQFVLNSCHHFVSVKNFNQSKYGVALINFYYSNHYGIRTS